MSDKIKLKILLKHLNIKCRYFEAPDFCLLIKKLQNDNEIPPYCDCDSDINNCDIEEKYFKDTNLYSC